MIKFITIVCGCVHVRFWRWVKMDLRIKCTINFCALKFLFHDSAVVV